MSRRCDHQPRCILTCMPDERLGELLFGPFETRRRQRGCAFLLCAGLSATTWLFCHASGDTAVVSTVQVQSNTVAVGIGAN